jgi:flagellar basal-body rod protein FlgF
VNSGVYTAYSGLRAQMDALDVLANNLANVNTTSYKEESTFYTYLNQSIGTSKEAEDLSSIITKSIQTGTILNTAGGSLTPTNRDLDIAIEGNGFLVVQTPRGLRYTRNGNLHLNAKGILTTIEGNPVIGVNKRPITLGPGEIHIGQDGSVSLDNKQIDRLKIVTFDNLSGLEKEGASLFVPKAGQGEPKSSDASIRSGYLEQSNVNAVSSVVRMVNIMRHFESLQKSVNLIMNEINPKSIDKLGR